MRKALLAAVIFLSGAAVATAQLQPLNVQTGAWEVTQVSTANGTLPPEVQARMSALPPEQRARIEQALRAQLGGAPTTNTYRSCITAADLNKQPFQSPNDRCNWTTLTSTGTDMAVHGTCRQANGGSGDVNVQIHAVNSQYATGSAQVAFAGNGGSINSSSTFTGKWISASCAGVN